MNYRKIFALGIPLFASLGFLNLQMASAAIGNGINLLPSYYNDGCVNFAWPLMEGISTVRIEIEPDKVDRARLWIREAAANGKTIIATYHDADVLGSDDAGIVMDAANWWLANYDTLAAEGAFTINLINEWGSHDQTPESFAAAYNAGISTVRQVYGGTIILDCAGWGQETHTVADASNLINDGNIMFSVHVYPASWNSATGTYLQNSDLDYLASVGGRPCIVGEFGHWSGGKPGKCDWVAVVNHAISKGWPVLAWAWNGDGSRGDMNMVTPGWPDDHDATMFTTNDYFTLMCGFLGNCGPGGTYEGSGTCCLGGGQDIFYISDITLSAPKRGKKNRAHALITVVDEHGNPVGGAGITGTFSGDINETASVNTAGDGVASLGTKSAVGFVPSFTFCVDTATHYSLVYDPSLNIETCDNF